MFPAQHVLSSRMHRAMQCIVAWLQQVLQFIGLGGSQSSNATLSAATSFSCQQKHQVLLTQLLLQRKCCSGKNERAHLSKSIRQEMRYRRRAKENARFQEAIEFSLHAFIASSGSTRPVGQSPLSHAHACFQNQSAKRRKILQQGSRGAFLSRLSASRRGVSLVSWAEVKRRRCVKVDRQVAWRSWFAKCSEQWASKLQSRVQCFMGRLSDGHACFQHQSTKMRIIVQQGSRGACLSRLSAFPAGLLLLSLGKVRRHFWLKVAQQATWRSWLKTCLQEIATIMQSRMQCFFELLFNVGESCASRLHILTMILKKSCGGATSKVRALLHLLGKIVCLPDNTESFSHASQVECDLLFGFCLSQVCLRRDALKKSYCEPFGNGDVLHVKQGADQKRWNKRVPVAKYPIVSIYVRETPSASWRVVALRIPRGHPVQAFVQDHCWTVAQVFHRKGICLDMPTRFDGFLALVLPSSHYLQKNSLMCATAIARMFFRDWLDGRLFRKNIDAVEERFAWLQWRAAKENPSSDIAIFMSNPRLAMVFLRELHRRVSATSSWRCKLLHCIVYVASLFFLRACHWWCLPSLCVSYGVTKLLATTTPQAHSKHCRQLTFTVVASVTMLVLGSKWALMVAGWLLVCPSPCLWWPSTKRTASQVPIARQETVNQTEDDSWWLAFSRQKPQSQKRSSSRQRHQRLKQEWDDLGPHGRQNWADANVSNVNSDSSLAPPSKLYVETTVMTPIKRPRFAENSEHSVSMDHESSSHGCAVERGRGRAESSATYLVDCLAGATTAYSDPDSIAVRDATASTCPESADEAVQPKKRPRGRPAAVKGFRGTPSQQMPQLPASSSKPKQGVHSNLCSPVTVAKTQQDRTKSLRSYSNSTKALESELVSAISNVGNSSSVSPGKQKAQQPWSFLVLKPDLNLCLARTCNGWAGGQCKSRPMPAMQFCKQHAVEDARKYGLVDAKPPDTGPDAEVICARFVKRQRAKVMGKVARHKMWYTRHAFFKSFGRLYPHLTIITQLNADQFKKCLSNCHRALRQNPHVTENLEQGAGPCSYEELTSDATSLQYNGNNRFYQWYTKGEMLKQLARQNTSLRDCTEKQYELALQRTSAVFTSYTTKSKTSLRPYAGPQCFPQREDSLRAEIGSEDLAQAKSSDKQFPADQVSRQIIADAFWLKCDKCQQERLVNERCIPALRTDEFLQKVQSHELQDWENWCRQESVVTRLNAAAVINQVQRREASTDEAFGEDIDEGQFVPSKDVPAHVTGLASSSDHALVDDIAQIKVDAEELPFENEAAEAIAVSSDEEDKLSLYREQGPSEDVQDEEKEEAADAEHAETSGRRVSGLCEKVAPELSSASREPLVQFACHMLQGQPADAGSKWETLSCSSTVCDAVKYIQQAASDVGNFQISQEVFILPYEPDLDKLESARARELLRSCRIGVINQWHSSTGEVRSPGFQLQLRVLSEKKQAGSEEQEDEEMKEEADCNGLSRFSYVSELPLIWRAASPENIHGFWEVEPFPNPHSHIKTKEMYFLDGSPLGSQQRGKCLILPCSAVRPHVAKFDVVLRKEPLQAIQAMHEILGHMLLFRCKVCKEQFPTFHPAWVPPAALELQLLKRGPRGVAACSIEVQHWEHFPTLHESTANRVHFGRCRACHLDMVHQRDRLNHAESIIVPKRSHLNNMDPCFRFPEDELRSLFDSAGIHESMLVALHHMQVNYMTLQRSRMHKFKKNVICFPQDFAEFAKRTGVMDGYRVGDRVNTVVPPGAASEEIQSWVELPSELKGRFAHDDLGRAIFAGTVIESISSTGEVKLRYDVIPSEASPQEGFVPIRKVESRISMPWHPSKLHSVLCVMLRRNVGRGTMIEGLQVRWDLVKRILGALSKLGHWHDTDDMRQTPMHRYYHPGLFDSQEWGVNGYHSADVGVWPDAGDARGASVEQLEVLGVRVNELPSDEKDAPETDDTDPRAGDPVDDKLLQAWLDTDLPLSKSLVHWWLTNDDDEPEENPSCLVQSSDSEHGDDDHGGARLCHGDSPPQTERRNSDVGTSGNKGVDHETLAVQLAAADILTVGALADWCLSDQRRSNDRQRTLRQLKGEFNRDRVQLVDSLGFELAIVSDLFVHEELKATACFEGKSESTDPALEAMRLAEQTTLGWPGVSEEPVSIKAPNRLVCAFPLEYPMGVADMYEDRVYSVPPAEYVQHMLRHCSRAFVNGSRGHRVLWALVNSQMLHEARQKVFGVYRTALKKIGGKVVGLAHISKAQIRKIMDDESQCRMLGGLLMSIGRDVRSTPMSWSYEGKKLDAAMKHLSWRPPWTRPSVGQKTTVDLDDDVRKLLMGAGTILHDEVGLNRGGALWWTLNAKYYLVHDIHRFSTPTSAVVPDTLRSNAEATAPDTDDNVEDSGAEPTTFSDVISTSQTRNLFLRDNPDIASYIFALRAELTMRIVMPTIVPHSPNAKFISMARFEVGKGGNPHFHGLSCGSDHPTIGNFKDPAEAEDDDPADDTVPVPELPSYIPLSQEDAPAQDYSDEDNTVFGTETTEADGFSADFSSASQQQRKGVHVAETKEEVEKMFQRVFGHIVSEWNPCCSDDGAVRYHWDDDVGAWDLEAFGYTTKEPEAIRLGDFLRKQLATDGEPIDLHPIRMLVARLVQTSCRHTKHNMVSPEIGKDACARGKEGACYCRYGFPHDLVDRELGLTCRFVRGQNGEWNARFSRNDPLCCSHEPHILLATLGNIDWRPLIYMHMVIEYVSKYATKAAEGSKKWQEILQAATEEVCIFVCTCFCWIIALIKNYLGLFFGYLKGIFEPC